MAKGIYREKVCFEHEDGRIFKFLKSLGDRVVRGVFVGHDHVNDYYAQYENIELVYGRKSGVNGYGGRYKKIIEQLKQRSIVEERKESLPIIFQEIYRKWLFSINMHLICFNEGKKNRSYT